MSLADDLHVLQIWVPIAVSVSAFLVSGLFTFCTLLMKFLKSNMNNGDGRSLRKAVDDLADSLLDHRNEMRDEIKSLRERVQFIEEKGR